MFNKQKFRQRVLPITNKETENGNQSGSSNENLTMNKESRDPVDQVLKQRRDFNLSYLGMVQNVRQTSSRSRDTDVQLIDQVEETQIEGNLPIVAKDEDKVAITVSRHGIKVVKVKEGNKQEVIQRHPLHTIAQLIPYSDGFGKQNIVVKIGGEVGRIVDQSYQCYIFQCNTEEEANAICQCVQGLFDAISTKP